MGLSHDLPSRACRLAFVMLLTWAWCGGATIAAAAQQQAEPPGATAARINAAADQVEKLYRAADVVAATMPRDTFDPAAVVETVGKEPPALFAWVRDHTTFVPYRGALRGPVGTLMDRLGNSLDRSLLLAELLKTAGHEVRLARGELSDDAARAALAKVRPMSAEPAKTEPAPSEQELNDGFDKLASQHGLDGAMLRELAKGSSERAASIAGTATKRGREQSDELAKLLGKPAAAAPADDADMSAIAEHWWVQHRSSGKWIDLDVMLPDAEPGRALAAAPKQTINYELKQGKLPLRPESCHEVDVRVVIEQSSKAGVREHVLLTHTLRPAELGGRRVTLGHVALNRPMTSESMAQLTSAAQLRDEALAHDEWMPTLVLGDGASFAQASFTQSGDVRRSPNVGALGGTRRAQEKATGLFGELPDGSDAAPKADAPQLTAEWIEYVIRSPGAEPRTIRRELFDFTGPSARAAAADRKPAAVEPVSEQHRLDRALVLMGQTEILATGATMSPAYVAHLEAECHRANARILPAMLRRIANEHADGSVPKQLDELRPPPGPLYLLACARSAWSPVRGNVYLDRPNVLTFRSELGADDTAEATGGLVARHGIDIVANEIAVRRGVEDPFAARLSQGVLDTNAEALLMSPPPDPGHSAVDPHAGHGGGGAAVENTAEAFAARGEDAWVVVRDINDPAREKLSLPDELRAAVDRDLRAGYAVVVPSKPTDAHGKPGLVWWRVDATSGDALGVNQRGMGIAFTEQQLLAIRVAFVIGSSLVCIYGVNHGAWGEAARGVGSVFCVMAGVSSGFGMTGVAVFGMTGLQAAQFSTLGAGLAFAIGTIRILNP